MITIISFVVVVAALGGVYRICRQLDGDVA